MARFHGTVGYGESAETPPGSGVWVNQYTEIQYTGDVVRNTRKLENSDRVNDDISVGNSISIVADQYANQHFHNIKYVKWMGQNWTVTMVEVRRPRLILTVGSVYNGDTA